LAQLGVVIAARDAEASAVGQDELVFVRAHGGLDWDAVRDAQGRTAAFLERYLKNRDIEGKDLAAPGR
jgi:hypothetical protein